MIQMPDQDIVIFDYLPGYRFSVKFSNNYRSEQFTVAVRENVDFNMRFNKNADFTYDNFSNFIMNTDIPDKMKSVITEDYQLDFVILNDRILKGLNIKNFLDGFYCINIQNNSGKFLPELYLRFAKEVVIPHLEPIYEGRVPKDPQLVKNLMNMSKIAIDQRCYGLWVKGANKDVESIVMAKQEYFADSVKKESERLLEEIISGKASSEFMMKTVKLSEISLANSSRIYDRIVKKLNSDPDFMNYKTEILQHTTEDWLNANIRKYVVRYFKDIVNHLKQEIEK